MVLEAPIGLREPKGGRLIDAFALSASLLHRAGRLEAR